MLLLPLEFVEFLVVRVPHHVVHRHLIMAALILVLHFLEFLNLPLRLANLSLQGVKSFLEVFEDGCLEF